MFLSPIFPFLLLFTSICSYDLKLSRDLSYYSSISYSIKNASKWSCGSCDEYPITDAVSFKDAKNVLFGYVGYSTKIGGIVVALRGTVLSVQNVKADLDPNQIPYPGVSGAKVQTSFYNDAKRLRDDIQPIIAQTAAKHPGVPIYVTGHSLGGVLATLTALHLDEKYKITAVYTYGEPRVGNQQFADYASKKIKIYRVINSRDPIPSFPMRSHPLKAVVDAAKAVASKTVEIAKSGATTVKKAAVSVGKSIKKVFHLQAVPQSGPLQVHEGSFVYAKFRHEGEEIVFSQSEKRYAICESESSASVCYNKANVWKFWYEQHLMSNYQDMLDKAVEKQWEQVKA